MPKLTCCWCWSPSWRPRHAGFLSALGRHADHAAVLPLLDKLAGAYRALPSLDDHLVWSHGLPFFAEFLRTSPSCARRASH